MKRFRVLSDLHIDVNDRCPFSIKGNDDFTVICGDTSGCPEKTVDWVNQNVRSGVLVSGNHLPYCNYDAKNGDKKFRIMSELRKVLADAFPAQSDITYLDVETGSFTKVVDGIMFIGSTMYTNMRISHDEWNKTGDKKLNMACSEWNMNDYNFGFTKREHPFGADNDPTYVKMTAEDYCIWFNNAFKAIDKVLHDNEKSENPLPVVLVTHHPVIKDFCSHSYYVENADYIYSQREFNWASYASDCEDWLVSHPSIKCYCCGHIHDPEAKYRHFYIDRPDRSKILVVNNTRGYVKDGSDKTFNPNRFVNTETWELEEEPEPEEMVKEKEERHKKLMKMLEMLYN